MKVKYGRSWYEVEGLNQDFGVWLKNGYHARWHYITKLKIGRRIYEIKQKRSTTNDTDKI